MAVGNSISNRWMERLQAYDENRRIKGMSDSSGMEDRAALLSQNLALQYEDQKRGQDRADQKERERQAQANFEASQSAQGKSGLLNSAISIGGLAYQSGALKGSGTWLADKGGQALNYGKELLGYSTQTGQVAQPALQVGQQAGQGILNEASTLATQNTSSFADAALDVGSMITGEGGGMGAELAAIGTGAEAVSSAAPAIWTGAEAAGTVYSTASGAPMITADAIGSTVGEIAGSSIGAGWAAVAIAARKILGAVLSNQSDTLASEQGRLMSTEPTLEGLQTDIISTALFGKDQPDFVKAWRVLADPVGAVLKALGCIIVTACTDRYSPEVNITREYRDKFLTRDQLRGYYFIAEKLVPKIESNKKLRLFIKKHLVDNLVEYGKYKLEKTNIKPSIKSIVISNMFLGIIKVLGKMKKSFVRANGEVY